VPNKNKSARIILCVVVASAMSITHRHTDGPGVFVTHIQSGLSESFNNLVLMLLVPFTVVIGGSGPIGAQYSCGHCTLTHRDEI
jgi:hypothetical protein